MRKITSAIAICLSLTGCFGDDTTETTTTLPSVTLYQGNGYSIEIPNDWEIMEKQQLTSNFPAATDATFRNNIKNELYTDNIVVSIRNLDESANYVDFAKGMQANAQKSLLDYVQTDSQERTMEIGELKIPTITYQFQGRKSPLDPVINFQELYTVHNGLGYSVTASYHSTTSEKSINTLQNILNSFTLQ